MTPSATPSQQSSETQAREFYNGLQRRVARLCVVLGCLGTAVTFAVHGVNVGVPFAAGCFLGWLNFAWMVRSTESLLTRVVSLSTAGLGSQAPRGGSAVFKFVLRYVLIGIVAYAILTSSVFSILGLFAGLFLPIGALMLEAFYEVWVSYRRGL